MRLDNEEIIELVAVLNVLSYDKLILCEISIDMLFKHFQKIHHVRKQRIPFNQSIQCLS